MSININTSVFHYDILFMKVGTYKESLSLDIFSYSTISAFHLIFLQLSDWTGSQWIIGSQDLAFYPHRVTWLSSPFDLIRPQNLRSCSIGHDLAYNPEIVQRPVLLPISI